MHAPTFILRDPLPRLVHLSYQVDDTYVQMLDALREMGELQNTFVLVTSDVRPVPRLIYMRRCAAPSSSIRLVPSRGTAAEREHVGLAEGAAHLRIGALRCAPHTCAAWVQPGQPHARERQDAVLRPLAPHPDAVHGATHWGSRCLPLSLGRETAWSRDRSTQVPPWTRLLGDGRTLPRVSPR